MAATSSKFPSWFALVGLLSVLSASAERNNSSSQCVDGTYQHGALSCCQCGAGLYLKKPCDTTLTYGICQFCDPGKYNSYPNHDDSCELCTLCSEPNANLVEVQPCTRARDAKCGCKTGHYCTSGTDSCRLCSPCTECGAEGIKLACTAKSNTVCNEKNEGGLNAGEIIGIIVAILALILGVILGIHFYRKKRNKRSEPVTLVRLANGVDAEMQPLTADLQPHLPAIAEVLGWKDMRDVAMKGKILDTRINSCQLNHPGDSQEQTLELLQIFVESQGRSASRNLVEFLRQGGKKAKAEKVIEILSPANASP